MTVEAAHETTKCGRLYAQRWGASLFAPYAFQALVGALEELFEGAKI
ncbi:MAG: hypothetical protein OSB69_19520 [Alphaproteobacteria bacterium]|nr:hypothetical protein [Alphaproteobacteria bacterium]